MKLLKFSLICLLSLPLVSQAKLILIGKVPGQYVGAAKTKSHLAKVVINNKVITEIKKITSSQVAGLKAQESSTTQVVVLKTGSKYDVMYPGLIDLHNHTKQNIISAWGAAKGQFANRFEWRAWSNYKNSVSGNMNAWIGLGKPITCAAFRWSEMQAMVVGTTYLQGPSSCVKKFGIHQVEDKGSYVSRKEKVQAPTDIIIPGDMVFVWNTLRPIMESEGLDYAGALKKVIHQYCPKLKSKIRNVMGSAEMKILSNQAQLKAGCGIKTKADEEKFPKKFVRYVYWIHKTVVGKLNYLKKPNRSAIIGHLAEGRRLDPYNRIEFPLLKLLGMDKPNVNLVHAVALDNSEFRHMGKKGMGLVWSPYSNLLLYGETARIDLAKKNNVLIALGSDWTPTGSRGVFEELKLAKQYVLKDPDGKGLRRLFSDEELYKMVTENPAKMLNHFETNPNDGDAGIGTLKKGAMGTLIVVKESKSNPYSNLVDAKTQNINLVVVDGVPMYGNESYMKDYKSNGNYEQVSGKVFDQAKLTGVPKNPGEKLSKEQKGAFLKTLAKYSKKLKLKSSSKCRFSSKKVMLVQETKDSDLKKFMADTGLNLDKFEDTYKLLASSILTQSRNKVNKTKGNPRFAVDYFPPLYSCDDPKYEDRLYNFVKSTSNSDEFSVNKGRRPANRKGFGSKPKSMAKSYNLEYERSDY